MQSGIDGGVELRRALDELSAISVVASLAPRGPGLASYLSTGLATEGYGGEYWWLTDELLTSLSIWWSEWTLQNLPVMVPWAIRDRAARYDCGPESWGAPNERGYFRDDNSIIKKLPLPLYVDGSADHRYMGRKPWRGFTACHIWRELPDGGIGGTDPFIYSFVANLVWLPSPLAPLSDRHESHVQQALQATSRVLFLGKASPSFEKYTTHAWSRLHAPTSDRALEPTRLATFEANRAFVLRRLNYIDTFIEGAEAALRGFPLPQKLFNISTRYASGLPLVNLEALHQFHTTLLRYRTAALSH